MESDGRPHATGSSTSAAESSGEGATGGSTGDDSTGSDDAGSGAVAQCGNGQVEGLEVCDDGNLNDGDDCTADCEAGSAWHIIDPEFSAYQRVAIASDDAVFVLAHRELHGGALSLQRVDADGTHQWTRDVAVPAAWLATDLIVDTAGNALVLANGGSQAAVVTRWNALGEVDWQWEVDSEARRMAAASESSFYLLRQPSIGGQITVERRDHTGLFTGSRRLLWADDEFGGFYGASVVDDGYGRVVVTGRRNAPVGFVAWTDWNEPPDDPALEFQVINHDDVLVITYAEAHPDGSVVVAATPGWARCYHAAVEVDCWLADDAPAIMDHMTIGPSGEMALAGDTGLVRYDSAGTHTGTLVPSGVDLAVVRDLAIDSNGSVLAVGRTSALEAVLVKTTWNQHE